MSIIRVLLPVAVIAAGVAAFASPASAKAPPDKLLTDAQAREIEQALQTADPRAIRDLASRLDAAGFSQQANDLREAADAIEAAVKNVPPVKAGDKPKVVTPTGVVEATGVPVLPKPGVSEPPSAERLLAAKTALMLTNSSAGRESKTLVKEYQLQEQRLGHSAVGKADGLYGPKTALTLAKFYNIVPPKPYYWPRQNQAAAKASYRDELLAFAAKDAPRAEEWRAAARV